MRKILLALICFIVSQNNIKAQHVWTVDSLMLFEQVKVKIQFDCDRSGSKTDTLFRWEYDILGRLVKNDHFIGGKVSMTRFFNYNQFNKADSIFTQFNNGNKYLSQANLFNEYGHLTEYYNCYEKTGCKLYEKYTYDIERLVSKAEFKNNLEDTKYIFKYDDQGNKIEELTYYKSGLSLKRINLFDDTGKKNKSISYSPKGSKMDSTLLEYDQNGNLTSLNWIGGLNTKSKYLYDNQGNNVEYQSLSMTGQIKDSRKMAFEGRLVKTRIHYKQNRIDKYFLFEYQKH